MFSGTKFFLGANSNIDFISYFKQLQERNTSMQLLILKGGPGSGKSSLMKRVASFALKKGHELEMIPCASDPDSLDAIIDYTANFAMMDGTAPHTEDPSLPGALHHIMYTGDLWDTKKLSKDKDIIEKLNTSIGNCHKGAASYIKAAAALLSENMRVSKMYLDKNEASKFVLKVTENLPSGKIPEEKQRLLSAVSVSEIKLFSETVSHLAHKIYIIDDKWGSASDYILNSIKGIAVLRGMNFIHCPCSIMPDKTDHLILPEASTAFVTQNDFMKFPQGDITSASQFYHSMPLFPHMDARKTDSSLLLEKASLLIKDAKLLHDELESFYIKAMDFSKMDGFFDKIIKRFYMNF